MLRLWHPLCFNAAFDLTELWRRSVLFEKYSAEKNSKNDQSASAAEVPTYFSLKPNISPPTQRHGQES